MLTAAVRDLHLANPGQFQTDIRTAADDLWLNNPLITPLKEGEKGVESLEMHYPLIHQCNQRPYHFIHGYPQHLEQVLGVRVPLSKFAGDVHLSPEEKRAPPPHADELPERFWIVMGGGKYDFTAKWWNPESYQAVVDHFAGKITFVQCGEAGHWHPPLKGVVNLIGKTKLREFMRLMYHADGVLCPVTFAMHLAAALETKPGRPKHRACVVVAGGREPPHWEAYPHHQFISNNGALHCCSDGGCWKSRCQLVGDGDGKDRHDLCVEPVQVSEKLRIPKCLHIITPEQVIQRIALYYDGGSLQYTNGKPRAVSMPAGVPASVPVSPTPTPPAKARTLPTATKAPPVSAKAPLAATKTRTGVRFYHGLGDCAYFAHLIPLYVSRGHQIEVECTPDKRLLFEAAGATCVAAAPHTHPWGYPSGGTNESQGRFWQGSKMGNNISAKPLADIGTQEELWDEYCRTRIDIRPRLPADAFKTVEKWLEKLPRPVVLLHTKGNTGQERKSLPDPITAEFYRSLLDQTAGSLILLDWDHRVPRLSNYRVRHLDDLGACPTEVLFALMLSADLMIGVDSGPLHLSRFTTTPTVGIWMPGHYPTTYTLPRPEQLNIVLAEPTRQWNRFKRVPWNLVEHPGATFKADILAGFCAQMLAKPKYLSQDQIAADVQMQQWIGDWCHGRQGNSLSDYPDRHTSFDVLFREIHRRFVDVPNQQGKPSPMIVETGTIRSEEDWGGAGFFTYLAGSYVHRVGGRLHSCDLSTSNCRFAREWTSIFGESVTIHEGDSVPFLAQFPETIDVLYLDSLDTTEPGHADHAQREIEAALPRLHDRSLVVFDDTPWQGGNFIGKGAKAVPWLLQHGWKILYAGYQVVLTKPLGETAEA